MAATWPRRGHTCVDAPCPTTRPLESLFGVMCRLDFCPFAAQHTDVSIHDHEVSHLQGVQIPNPVLVHFQCDSVQFTPSCTKLLQKLAHSAPAVCALADGRQGASLPQHYRTPTREMAYEPLIQTALLLCSCMGRADDCSFVRKLHTIAPFGTLFVTEVSS